MLKLKIWITAFRLRTLPLALSSTLMGSLIAYSRQQYSWAVFVFGVLTTLFLQILSNLANDYGDAKKGTDNEDRVGPLRVTQSGLVKPGEIKRMIVFFVILSLLSGISLIYFGLKQLPFFISLVFFFVGLVAIFAAIKYTIGKNPYGYVGMGDVFVFLFFGLVGICGTFYLHTGYIDLWMLLPASSVGLLSSGVLNLNNLRDVENDKQCGKHTLVVRLGIKTAKLYHICLLLCAVLFGVIYTVHFYNSAVQFLFILTLPMLLNNAFVVLRNKVPVELDNELKKLALTTFAFSITFGLGLIL